MDRIDRMKAEESALTRTWTLVLLADLGRWVVSACRRSWGEGFSWPAEPQQ
jgi:hypothetical protein